ncbi:MAG TPA: hypothetical protein VG078_07115, partial [Acidimicrobiales bacterium]|nr:hypothetical protein [Acidimicrobiales bacterium]
ARIATPPSSADAGRSRRLGNRAGVPQESLSLSPKFRRTPEFLRQVESLAHYKLRPPGEG